MKWKIMNYIYFNDEWTKYFYFYFLSYNINLGYKLIYQAIESGTQERKNKVFKAY